MAKTKTTTTTTIGVRAGEVLNVVGLPKAVGGEHPSHPIVLPGDPSWEGPVDPGYGIPETPKPGGPVDPGYSPPWAQVPEEPPPTEPPPVDPGYSPPWAQVGGDTGHWVWAWSPQLKRWVWVKVPGEGEAGPKSRR